MCNEDEHRLDHASTARSSTTSSSARSCAAAATASAPPATPRSIVHAWEEWGEDCFDRFNGQWAIALWDRREQRLVLSPRPARRAPALLHARPPHGLLFASEVKALFADPAVPRAFDPAGLDQVLTYWSTVAPRTVFARHRAAPARPRRGASTATGSGRAAVLEHRLPRPAAPSRGQDLDDNAAALRERLIEAARLRFVRSDVPVGAYLSGGLDSVGHRRGRSRGTPTRRCTRSRCASPTREFDEGDYQQRWSPTLGTQHHEVVVSGPPTSPRSSPTSSGTPRRPMLRVGPGAAVPAVAAGARTTATRSSSPARAPTRCSAATTSSARRGCASSGPATPARPCGTGRSSCSTRGWRATPGRPRPSPAASSARTSTPTTRRMSHRPRWDSTARAQDHAHPRPAGGRRRTREPRRWSPRMPAEQRRAGTR